MENACSKCGAEAAGYKCDLCGAEFSALDEGHECGADHCRPKCSGCDEAETNCTC